MCANASNAINGKARQLLFELRGGDYAHAGDLEAINLVLDKLTITGPTLDIGSGYGGTLDYFKRHGFTDCVGIDIDADAISYANDTYPDLKFQHVDALMVDNIFPPETFNLVYAFNSLYAIEDKHQLLAKLNRISKPSAMLVIFDYSSVDKQLVISSWREIKKLGCASAFLPKFGKTSVFKFFC